MCEHAGPDETGVKLRDANWLSGVIEPPSCKQMEKHIQSDTDNNAHSHKL